jgi:cobalamin biosynthesis protein CobW
MLGKTPVTIVTGFLGSGKTTLIRHLLTHAHGRRLALIVNEFGDVGVDGDILKSCGATSCPEENIVELTNGCICCTVADDFAPAISALLARTPRPEHIVIETSGLALPKPLVKAFDWPELRAKLTVDGVIAVVDASAVAEGRFADDPEAVARQRQADPSLDHDNPLEEVYEDQLLCADMIVLNKTDLVSAPDIARVKADIAQVAPRAVKVVETQEGRIDPDVLLGLKAAAEDDLAHRPSHHDAEEGHDHDDFDTFIVDLPAIDDPAAFVARLAEVARKHQVLRMKGFLEVASKPMRLLVQGVGQRFRREFDRPWGEGEARRSHLVVIGEKGVDRGAITQALLAS